MGRKSESGGVRESRGKVQLDFVYQGERRRPILDLTWNERNRRVGHKLRAEIQEKIRNGVFDLDAYFPSYEGALPDSGRARTFKDFGDLWLASLSELAESTRHDYRKVLERVWYPALGGRAISGIRYSDIIGALAELPIRGKTRNNNLIPLRQVFAFAELDHAINSNPAAAIKNSKVQRPEPDPFEIADVDAILADLAEHESPAIMNYFAAAFFAGFRPSEQVALRWPDVDLRQRTARVQRAIVRGKAKDSTKTYQSRDVELNNRALAAFEAQRALTQLADKEVFNNPATGRPWADIQMQHRIWVRCLKRLKMRYRVPYQTRHTFATLALMAGANPSWVARQLGHANTGMLFKVYSKWIDGADRSRERGKMDAAYAPAPISDLAAIRQQRPDRKR